MKVIEFSVFRNSSYSNNSNEIPVESQGFKGVFHTVYNNYKRFVLFELGNAIGNEIYQLSAHNIDNNNKITSLEAKSDSCFCALPSLDKRYKFTCIVNLCTINTPIDEILRYCKENSELLLTFKCTDGEGSAPILLMTARSPVLHAMMNSDCIEAKTRIVEIKDFSIKIVQKMIEFCQTNIILKTDGFEVKLAEIADKYDIKLMKSYTEDLLIKNIRSKNVIVLYQFSQKYNNPSLATSCISFASDNFLEIISSTDATNVDDNVLKKFWIKIHIKMKRSKAVVK